ncbi:MAG: hypothetical protein ACOVRN_19925 [Flavobacterium sp.]
MSSASYPLGMRPTPASGYNHHSTVDNKQYVTWKGTGVNSFPVGTAPGHIRPLTNNDPGNVFPTGFGLPRPIKHFRKGRAIPSAPTDDPLVNYNMNRYVISSKGTSLGGGSGGSGLLNDMQDKPGAYIVALNSPSEPTSLDAQCAKCEGVGIVASYKPNLGNLIENPEPVNTSPQFCCNLERNARQRVIYASTNLNKNYYTTTKQYLQNRCKTYDQKAFNFLSYRTNDAGPYDNNNPYYASAKGLAKPGSPAALDNMYLANCQPNTQLYEGSELAFIYQMMYIMVSENIVTQSEADQFYATGINSIRGFYDWMLELPEPQKENAIVVFEVFINNPYWGMPPSGPTNPAGCQLTVYKPNNYQYAKQGAVSSSTRMLKLNVDTISSNAASTQRYNNTGQFLITANQLQNGDDPNVANLTKSKVPPCNTPWPLNFSQSRQYQNKKFCHYFPEYQIPLTQPSPYRYYPGTVFSTNHFAQSPYRYITTTGTR